MKANIKTTIHGMVAAFVLALGVAVLPTALVQPAYAECSGDVNLRGGVDCAKSEEAPDELTGSEGVFTTIVNVLLFIIGAIAVIMLIIGGIRYTTSNGDSNQVTAAKNTILYAIIGIIVAILAYAVVNFVVGTFAVGD